VSRSEPKTEVHSSNGRFEVTMVEPRSTAPLGIENLKISGISRGGLIYTEGVWKLRRKFRAKLPGTRRAPPARGGTGCRSRI
jgi:hypothetical protein